MARSEVYGAGLELQLKGFREGYREELAGLSLQERTRLAAGAADLSKKYPSVDITKIREMGAGAKNAYGELDKAMQILPSFTQAYVALQTSNPSNVDTQMKRLNQALDIMGRTENPERTRTLVDGIVRAVSVERDQLNFEEIGNFAKRAKVAGSVLSPEFLTQIAPTMIQQSSGHTAGTQMATTLMALTGNKMKKESRGNLAAAGLFKNGKMVDSSTLVSNPFLWAQKNLMPVLGKKGIDVEGMREGDTDRGMKARVEATKALAPFFSDRNVLSLFQDFAANYSQYARNVEQYRNARGLDQAEDARRKDPFVALEAATAQTRNAIAALGEAASPTATKALNNFADWANKFAGIVRDNPKTSEELMRNGAVPAAGLASIGAGSALSGVGGITGGILAPALVGLGAVGFMGGWSYAGRQKRAELEAKVRAQGLKGQGPAASPLWRYSPGRDHTFGSMAAPGMPGMGFSNEAVNPPGGFWRTRNATPFQSVPSAPTETTAPIDPLAGAGLGATIVSANDAFSTSTSYVTSLGEAATRAAQNTGSASGMLNDLAAAAASAAGGLRNLVNQAMGAAAARPTGGGDVAATPSAAPGRWSGGSVYPGSVYRVNEAGEEFFSPGTSGRIVPDLPEGRATGGAPLSMTNSIHVTVNGGERDAGTIAEEVIAKINDRIGDSMNALYADIGMSPA